MYLMNGDKPVLYFDFNEGLLQVIDNDFLPYSLKDYIKTSDYSSPMVARQSARHMETVRDFFANRTLNLSRENAKAILTSCGFPQSNRTEERIAIALSCNSLSMTDNFWTRDDNDNRLFKEVDLREHHLGDAAFPISVLGIPASIEHDILIPDIGTQGMFIKTWHRGDDGCYLLKSDKTTDNINTRAEIAVSEILENGTNVKHVDYSPVCKEGKLLSSCKCLTNARYSMITAQDLYDWCSHTGRDFTKYMEDNYLQTMSVMCVADYLIANTDRHFGNIFFYVDNTTNLIVGMTPLLDHNQALISDILGKDVSDLIYPLTGLTIKESAEKYARYSGIVLSEAILRTPDILKEITRQEIMDNVRIRIESLGLKIRKGQTHQDAGDDYGEAGCNLGQLTNFEEEYTK